MSDPLHIRLDHTAPGRAMRQHLREALDLELVADGAALDRANDAGHPDNQALYVEFAGEHPSAELALDHIWYVWLVQRRDYPDWEVDYGRLRAKLFCFLDGWQPGADLDALQPLRAGCAIEDYPGLRVDLTAWRVTELKFAR